MRMLCCSVLCCCLLCCGVSWCCQCSHPPRPTPNTPPSALLLPGPLPPAWGALSKLRVCYLGNNTLSGPLPGSWSGMAALEDLQLSINVLTGGEDPGEAGICVAIMLLTPGATCPGRVGGRGKGGKLYCLIFTHQLAPRGRHSHAIAPRACCYVAVLPRAFAAGGALLVLVAVTRSGCVCLIWH
jgi:hypothetical protein